MNAEQRAQLIDQLDRSFAAMPRWAQTACKHGMSAPTINRDTGKPFESFREVIESSHNETLLTLREDFDDNGDLLPVAPPILLSVNTEE
ncbi:MULTISPECIES: hypothetical protein [unclassified Pseudomonas]|uniref:hypothetical protein n=1 Tax=unclassified Pseudomonas TaxID=196821 RepID=UPI002B22A692|nr:MULTISPECIES: hypothetical protein [unclassified Pseudomonas]MEA9994573.1 hypothetical protein [Pseudomonas sp. AA4]MEB0085718.1 hypothetical protein [Pseudomonas sp. RTI1]MEB0125957.1 hypothetical protein [Pseudomonas sp. CCC1.2]MEB0152761.1 hypothetical protein [Pseudomonas sp. CCC4.3]MEB0221266.1 hypothetical protein [Pseudomonas sp. AB12(2023)]